MLNWFKCKWNSLGRGMASIGSWRSSPGGSDRPAGPVNRARRAWGDLKAFLLEFLDWKAAHWQSPFQSLPGRITFFVFAATLMTSLAVAAISVGSINRFLRGKIDQKFPAVLAATSHRLERWYDQRVVDIGVFSNSEIVVRNMGRFRPGARKSQLSRARIEIEQYLRYVHESFPLYKALFLLDREGRELLWVGEDSPLPPGLANSLADVGTGTVSDILTLDGRRVQVASARVEDASERMLGSVHAVLDLTALEGILATMDLGPSGRTFVVGSNGRYLSDTAGRANGQRYNRRPPMPDEEPVSESYENDAGERVIGSAVRFGRFGWTLAVEQPYDVAFAPVFSGVWRTVVLDLVIVLIFGLGAFRIAVSIVKPIEALSDAARRTSEGEKGVVIPETKTRDEIGLLTRTFNQMSQRLASNARELEARYDELHRMNEVLAQLSITDGLTRLHNHRFFQDTLIREAKRADRTNEPLTLVLLDIDHFKLWNDRFGHAIGDEILRQLADILNGLVRETDLLARYGGEEFALLAPSTDLEGAVRLAEKMRATVSDTTFVLDQPCEDDRVTVSVGVAAYRGDRKSLFTEADRALYRAKSSGRDCVMTAFDEGETRV